jgi:hypothetical protein
MHNANYTKEMNSNEEIFQLEIKSRKFHQRGSQVPIVWHINEQ